MVVFAPTGTAQVFASLGPPAGLAYVVMPAELLGAAALLLGIWTRIGLLVFALVGDGAWSRLTPSLARMAERHVA